MSERRTKCIGLLLLAAASAAPAQTLDDPTRPDHLEPERQAAAAPASPWALSSIVFSDERKLAVINGQIVKVGDRIAGATVLEILPYAVRLQIGNETRTAQLLAGSAHMKRAAETNTHR